MDVEKELRALDFSRFSKVQETLRLQLLKSGGANEELELDELDYVTAAGSVQKMPKRGSMKNTCIKAT